MTSVREALIQAYCKTLEMRPARDEEVVAAFERELEARGFAVVPIKMTDDMWHAADMEFSTEELWAAALAARPRCKDEW